MTTNHDFWEAEVETAFASLPKDEAGLRVEIERLGFTSVEIDGFLQLERSLAACTDPAFAKGMRGRR